MERLFIDVLGLSLGIAVAFIFYSMLWSRKKINLVKCLCGILIIMVGYAVSVYILLNTPLLSAVSFITMFLFSFFFESGFKAKLLFSLVVSAMSLATELLVARIFMNLLGVPLERLQNDLTFYFIGVVISNLTALLLVLVIRFFMKGYNKDGGTKFFLLTSIMPVQSIVISFVVYFYSIEPSNAQVSPLGVIAILVSVSLVFVVMFIVKKLRISIDYESELITAEVRLNTQIEQYKKLYEAQKDLRVVRHDFNNDLISIFGLMEDGRYEDAKSRVQSISSSISKAAFLVNTEIPELDAVINTKMDKAMKLGIETLHRIKLVDKLIIDSYDLAKLVASALDNAIEGINRSYDVDKTIILSITNVTGCVSVAVENHTTGPVYKNFKSSKPDKANHGFGMKQMKDIASKYSGDFNPVYDEKRGVFSLKVLLQNKKI